MSLFQEIKIISLISESLSLALQQVNVVLHVLLFIIEDVFNVVFEEVVFDLL
jgi:hypothetical protein